MRMLICDDEALARQRLRHLAENLEQVDVIGEAVNGKEALLLCHQHSPDIVLLDIRMPVMDGIEAARHLAEHEHPPAVIFTTAYGDHALSAFEANAVDYLLKPIRLERLQQALVRAHSLNHAQWQALNDAGDFSRARTHLCARRQDTVSLIPISDICYLQADQKYVTVRHLHGEDLIEESLKSLETEFAPDFIRIHRNALVARTYLAGIEKTKDGRLLARFSDCPDTLEISRRHASQVRKWLKQQGQ